MFKAEGLNKCSASELIELERNFEGWLDAYGETAELRFVMNTIDCLEEVRQELERRSLTKRWLIRELPLKGQGRRFCILAEEYFAARMLAYEILNATSNTSFIVNVID